jgi:phosphatidate cytidylyltransferase
MLERIRTGLVLVAIVLLCMFATKSPIPMILLMLVVLSVGAAEWTKFGKSSGQPYQYPMLFVVFNILFACGAYFLRDYCPETWPSIWGVATVFWLSAFITVRRYPLAGITSERWLPMIGLLLLSSSILAIFSLWEKSPWWLMYLFALVWVADSGAYFAGKAFGKHKLIPDVSPNKTIEGLMGGLALTTGVIVAVAYYRDLAGVNLVGFILLSVLVVLASVLGDLFESLLKRKAKIKDSGTLLPGHGGVLDRIDSLLAAAPIFALGFWLVGGF